MTSAGSHRRLVLKLFGMSLAMFGFGYLMVPIYDILCDITGLNGKTGIVSAVAAENMRSDSQRSVIVQFTATVNNSGPWEFQPVSDQLSVIPGEAYTVEYSARNLSTQAQIGQASPSVAPLKAANYFNKIECFCFTQQSFAAGEQRNMPVTFVVDPALPQEVDSVTLSYTMFRMIDS